MQTSLAGIPGINVYPDDVISSGSVTNMFYAQTTQVLSKLDSAGLKLKKECKLTVSEGRLLGTG